MPIDGGDRAAAERVAIHWQGRAISASPGEDAAAALFAAGILILGYSRKFHRPLGLSGIFLAGVKGHVEGLPNQRFDLTPVRAGLALRPQNVWPDGRFDLQRLARLIPPRWLRGGFEHPAWLPGGSGRFQVWESFLRLMAGGGDAVDPNRPGAGLAGERLTADVAIVGGGPAGRQAARQAVASGRAVILVSRSGRPGTIAEALGGDLPALPDSVLRLAGHEAAALYRQGRLLVCTPRAGGPAKLIETRQLVLATGRISVPPLVPGADLPGVLELRKAVELIQRHGAALGRIVLIGSGDLAAIGRRLGGLGANILATRPAGELRRIEGRRRIERAIFDSGSIGCDSLVHAGPWRADPSLPFQAGADGEFRLSASRLPPHVEIIGSAAIPPEPIAHGPALDDGAMACPCMDVTVGEIRDLVAAGHDHVEELKRLTGCGMGPCQGFPCWDLLAAALAAITGRAAESFGHPSYRPPRGALTLAQAAGLAHLVQPEREP